MKAWIIKHCDVKEDATDDDFRLAAGNAMATGDLTPEKFAELTADKDAEKADEFSKKLDAIYTAKGVMEELRAGISTDTWWDNTGNFAVGITHTKTIDNIAVSKELKEIETICIDTNKIDYKTAAFYRKADLMEV